MKRSPPPGLRSSWHRSLRWRLLRVTLVSAVVALLAAGLVLDGFFRFHVRSSMARELSHQLDELSARVEFDADGRPDVDDRSIVEPRWSRPFSGLYWQIDQSPGPGPFVLRSRSLWDAHLPESSSATSVDPVSAEPVPGPRGESLMVVERRIRSEAGSTVEWRLRVGGDLAQTEQSIRRFDEVLGGLLLGLLAAILVAAWAQIAFGFRPLRRLTVEVERVGRGEANRIPEGFPVEVQPLVDGFNRLLDQNQTIVDQARSQAGNLAHALKTPLTVLEQATQPGSRRVGDADLSAVVLEQVRIARRHVEWELAKARSSARRDSGVRTHVPSALAGLIRTLERLHHQSSRRVECRNTEPGLWFSGQQEDFQEMVGNLLDNAFKWADSCVRVEASRSDDPQRSLLIVVEDDGPGIQDADRDRVLMRGERLDETIPGSGLGLSIVADLASNCGGALTLGRSSLGGLSARLSLPGFSAELPQRAPE